MNTTTEILTVDGVVLNTMAKNISSLAGRLRVPSLRTENVRVPGRHGTIRTPNKKFDENQIVLPMWVAGCDDDGRIPTGSNKRKEFYKRVDEITKLFKASNRPLDIRHTLPDGSVRQIFGDVTETMDWTTSASPKGLVSVAIVCPDPFWQDVDPKTQSLRIDGRTSTTASTFAEATAPMEDMVYDIVGPWTNPKLIFADGTWVAYDVALAAGQSVTVDSGEWILTGAGGHTADYTKLRHDGEDPFWAALPASSQDITLEGTGRVDGQSALRLTGRRKYLIG